MNNCVFRRVRRLLLYVLLLLPVVGGDSGAAVSHRLVGGDLRLVADGAGAWVERANGERERVSTRSDVLWRRIVPLASGWLAAGSRTDRKGVGEQLVLVLRSATGELRELPQPGETGSEAGSETGGETGAERGAVIRSWPVPIAADGALTGLVWLEGDRPTALAVRSAIWDGEGWREAVTVARPAPGTQTALSGTTLPDGRALITWSAFDGVADEIVWSVGFGSLWTGPAVLHVPNGVPDVIPAVVSIGDRVFAAWSRFDGDDYRLQLAEWSTVGWSELAWRGGRGSLFPSFVTSGDRAWLLYGTTVPKQWNVVEVAAGRGVVREGALDVPADSALAARPIVDLRSDAPELVWYASDAAVIDRRDVRWSVR